LVDEVDQIGEFLGTHAVGSIVEGVRDRGTQIFQSVGGGLRAGRRNDFVGTPGGDEDGFVDDLVGVEVPV